MKCTICGHEPIGLTYDRGVTEFEYFRDGELVKVHLCNFHLTMVIDAAGREIERLKDLEDDEDQEQDDFMDAADATSDALRDDIATGTASPAQEAAWHRLHRGGGEG